MIDNNKRQHVFEELLRMKSDRSYALPPELIPNVTNNPLYTAEVMKSLLNDFGCFSEIAWSLTQQLDEEEMLRRHFFISAFVTRVARASMRFTPIQNWRHVNITKKTSRDDCNKVSAEFQVEDLVDEDSVRAMIRNAWAEFVKAKRTLCEPDEEIVAKMDSWTAYMKRDYVLDDVYDLTYGTQYRISSGPQSVYKTALPLRQFLDETPAFKFEVPTPTIGEWHVLKKPILRPNGNICNNYEYIYPKSLCSENLRKNGVQVGMVTSKKAVIAHTIIFNELARRIPDVESEVETAMEFYRERCEE
tara:strand:- start:607 stop:1515 length:909 start_codon:yes stop_codon:yes gene_type:complete